MPVVDLTMALVDLIGMTVGGASLCSGICETARCECWMLFFYSEDFVYPVFISLF